MSTPKKSKKSKLDQQKSSTEILPDWDNLNIEFDFSVYVSRYAMLIGESQLSATLREAAAPATALYEPALQLNFHWCYEATVAGKLMAGQQSTNAKATFVGESEMALTHAKLSEALFGIASAAASRGNASKLGTWMARRYLSTRWSACAKILRCK